MSRPADPAWPELAAVLRAAGLPPRDDAAGSLVRSLREAAPAVGWLLPAGPRAPRQGWCQWLPSAGRLAWWRAAPTPLRTLASSRPPCSPRRHDARRRMGAWFDAVRALVAGCRGGAPLLTVESTTLAPLAGAAASAMGVARRHARLAASWTAWGHRIREAGADIEVSPLIDGLSRGDPLPPADQIAWALAGELDLLHVRAGGAWERRLATATDVATATDAPQRVSISTTLRGSRDAVGSVLRAGGSVHGYRRLSRPAPAPVPAPRRPGRAAHTGSRAAMAPLWERAPVLIHCTRACDGPWPDETQEAFLLAQLTDRCGDRSAAGALLRIARQRRLAASGRCVRGGSTVVCLSASHPTDLCACYRRHRRRWDRAPWGVALDRQCLARLDARPVVYGDEAVWRQLDSSLRPFFQAVGADERWRDEREWRCLGDVLLEGLPPDAVEFFVPREADAERLQPQCPWVVRWLDA